MSAGEGASAKKLPPLTLNGWLRWDLVSQLLDELGPIESVVEVGCGGGAVSTRLAQRYHYVGFEPDPVSAATAAMRLAAVGRGRVRNEALPDAPDLEYDLLVAFEVLEHLEDDVAAMRSWSRWIRPGGAIVLSVPAHADQFGHWDRRVGHYRRYERSGLTRVFESAGLVEPQIHSYGFPLGHVLQGVRNSAAKLSTTPAMAEATAESGRLLQPRDGFAWTTRLATAPFRLMQRPFVSTDLGTGFVAAVRRPR